MHGEFRSLRFNPKAGARGRAAANRSHKGERHDMNGQIEKQNGNQKSHAENRACAPRDWERSEWFRRWLELIRAKKPQAAG